MKAKKPQQSKPTESAWITLAGYIKTLLDIIVTVYLFLIIAVMPFYFQEGYNHIGSDKSYFFRSYTGLAAKFFLPVLAAYLLCRLADRISARRGKRAAEGLRQSIRGIPFSLTDLFAAGYALSVILSYVCTKYKATALWGASGWYMGTIPQLMLVGIYFAVSRFWKAKNWMIFLFFPVSAAVFALGYLNRFGVWPLPMENSGLVEYISTIGNMNWYCGYMVCVLFLGVGAFWLEESGRKLRVFPLALYCFIGFATAITQGSDSGLFALAVIFWVLFVLSSWKAKEHPGRMRRFWELVLLLDAACAMTCILAWKFPEGLNYRPQMTEILISRRFLLCLAIPGAVALGLAYMQKKNSKIDHVAVSCYRVLAGIACVAVPAAAAALTVMIVINTKQPGSLGALSERALFTFNESWGSSRGITWRAGWQCFRDQDLLHKLVGVGSDCMSEHIYRGGNEALLESVNNVFPGLRLTNAHGEWITILANSGLLGFASFVGFIGSVVFRLLRSGVKTPMLPVIAGSGLCALAYTANNFWSFQQSMSVATIFVMIGIGENYLYFKDKHGIM